MLDFDVVAVALAKLADGLAVALAPGKEVCTDSLLRGTLLPFSLGDPEVACWLETCDDRSEDKAPLWCDTDCLDS